MSNATKLPTMPIYIWLDSSANSNSHSLNMLEKHLKTKLANLKTFNNIDDFKEFIQTYADETFVLLVSGTYGRQIVPEIHSLPQLLAVYVYCSNKARNEEWAKEYIKV
ncbi:unnamed protein product [Didymodactylos carnosus]|uniref:Uncharacterized protein n=1 Tax=Didymodactylos carnosus TaxID=1234261 RepID=A0A8S2UHL8_9BILA|nr:unnamed protein product [Didymodactylos carnosus]CAF4345355.1 unnamed protein product [Didymodactylos carnosus]